MMNEWPTKAYLFIYLVDYIIDLNGNRNDLADFKKSMRQGFAIRIRIITRHLIRHGDELGDLSVDLNDLCWIWMHFAFLLWRCIRPKVTEFIFT